MPGKGKDATTSQVRSVVIGTAGHIDHGKTTLVRALTGIDTDRLSEEKRRGITIDLGFASMTVSPPAEYPDGSPMTLSFVDVPGHSLFVRNMLAGAGCVSSVMLVIAADEGIKPQTIEHLAICELLGISSGIVAITKVDAVKSARLAEVTEQIRILAKGSFLGAETPIVPVSAQTGEGLDALRLALVKLALSTPAPDSDAPLRLPLDRSFVIRGFGAVVTGTLLSGALREGDTLVLQPGTRTVRVRGLETHGEGTPSVQAGTRVAVNLSGIDASEVHRGQALVAPHTLVPVDTIDVEARLLEGSPPMKHRSRVHFHAFTAETMASVSLYGYDAARPGVARLMRLKLDQPIVLVPGDRFVLRQPAPVATIGGGRVLDTSSQPRPRKAETLAWLEKMRASSLTQQMALRVERSGTAGIGLAALAREMGLTIDAARRYFDTALERSEMLLLPGDLLLSRDALRRASDRVMKHLELYVQKSQRNEVKSSELRSQTALIHEVLEYVLSALAKQQQIQLTGDTITLPGFSIQSASRETERLAAIAETYKTAGLTAPSVLEVAQRLQIAQPEVRRFITLLQRQKTIVRMGSDDLFIHADALRKLAEQMALLRGTLIDVGRFKQLTGLSRKYAIPLLEHLDRERITRKHGDQRLVL